MLKFIRLLLALILCVCLDSCSGQSIKEKDSSGGRENEIKSELSDSSFQIFDFGSGAHFKLKIIGEHNHTSYSDSIVAITDQHVDGGRIDTNYYVAVGENKYESINIQNAKIELYPGSRLVKLSDQKIHKYYFNIFEHKEFRREFRGHKLKMVPVLGFSKRMETGFESEGDIDLELTFEEDKVRVYIVSDKGILEYDATIECPTPVDEYVVKYVDSRDGVIYLLNSCRLVPVDKVME